MTNMAMKSLKLSVLVFRHYDKITEKSNLNEERFIFTYSLGGVNSWLAMGLRPTEMSWWKSLAEESCSLHNSQEAEGGRERQREREPRDKKSLQRHVPMSFFLQSGPPLQFPAPSSSFDYGSMDGLVY
jgi:hypothetical protein